MREDWLTEQFDRLWPALAGELEDARVAGGLSEPAKPSTPSRTEEMLEAILALLQQRNEPSLAMPPATRVAHEPAPPEATAVGVGAERVNPWVTNMIWIELPEGATESARKLQETLKNANVTLAGARHVRTLRSGEKWNDRLLQLIDQANLFQLCWSTNAVSSTYVKQEYQHALRRAVEGFVRPGYWEEPMPPAPPELAAFHFARLNLPPRTR